MRLTYVVAGLIAFGAGFSEARPNNLNSTREDSGHPDKENKLKGSAPDGSASPPCDEPEDQRHSPGSLLRSILPAPLSGVGNHLLASDGDHYTTQPSHADGSSHKSSPLDEIRFLIKPVDHGAATGQAPTTGTIPKIADGESSLIHQVISPNLPVVGPAFEGSPAGIENIHTLPVPFQQDPSGVINPIISNPPVVGPTALSNLPVLGDGTPGAISQLPVIGDAASGSPLNALPINPSEVVNPLISNLPVGESTGNSNSGVPSLPVDPSNLVNRVFSNLPAGQSGGTGSHAGPLGSLPVDPTSLVSPVLSNFPVGQPGNGNSGPLPVDPSSLITPVISNLPQSAGNILPGGSSLPVDPSSLIDRVTSNLPVGQSTGAGNTGSPLSSLPVDTTSLINPVISNLPVGQSLGSGLPGAASLPVDPSSLINRVTSNLPLAGNGNAGSPLNILPVNPTSVVNPVVSQLPVGQLASDGNSGANSLPVDPSSLINPVISNLPIGSSGGSLLPGASSLPTDPSSLVNRVASNLPIVGNGSPTAPLNSLPADPSSLINPVISNLPVGQTDNNGNNAPGASSLPLPVADSLIGSTIPNLAGIGGNAAASNLPIPNSLTSGLPIPQLPVLQPAVEGNPGGYSSNVPSGHY
ncbi:hypothetical protein MJO29_011644 [Puccinia striiformis f. sp. tritici]|nr:hypothetical protein MJO29_011644 [Puccinia striiformis f. sp. tritici]